MNIFDIMKNSQLLANANELASIVKFVHAASKEIKENPNTVINAVHVKELINTLKNNPSISQDTLNIVAQAAENVGSFETANEIKSIIQQRQERIEAPEKAKVFGDILTKAFETVGLNPDISLNNINKENIINELTKRLEIFKNYEELATKYLLLEEASQSSNLKNQDLMEKLQDSKEDLDQKSKELQESEINLVKCEEKLDEYNN